MTRIPLYCNIAHELKRTEIKTHLSRLCDQVWNCAAPAYESLHLKRYDHSCKNGVSAVKKTKRLPWFHESRYAVTVQRKLSTVSRSEPPQKFRFTNSINCLMSLAAFVKGKPPETASRWSSDGWSGSSGSSSQSTLLNQARCPILTRVTHNRTLNSEERFGILEWQVPTPATCNCPRQFLAISFPSKQEDFLQPNLFLVIKPYYICRKLLIYITWDLGEQQWS
jgi:hypothetical protein